MNEIRSICVYCGSGPGKDPVFVAAAKALGAEMARENIQLVYGGGSIGLMGTIAGSVLANGGRVVGIIPEFLSARERAMRDADELIITRDMHERKRTMFERADAFVALPGGVGTLEEIVEMLTWSQLGQHDKPILLANISGFWEPLIALFRHMHELEFIREGLMLRYDVADKVEDIVPTLRAAARRLREVDEETEAQLIKKM